MQRAQEILNRPELQPARAMTAEIERFVQHKLDTNRFSKASADSKRYILRDFAATVRDIAPANVTVQHCKAFYIAERTLLLAARMRKKWRRLNWTLPLRKRSASLRCLAAKQRSAEQRGIAVSHGRPGTT